MAFAEIELKRIDSTVGSLCRRRTHPKYSDRLRFVYEVDGHTVSIYEERPAWRGRPGEWTSHGVARFRFVRTRNIWKLYWMRADLKWHLYEPGSEFSDLASLVEIVERDEWGAFFG